MVERDPGNDVAIGCLHRDAATFVFMADQLTGRDFFQFIASGKSGVVELMARLEEANPRHGVGLTWQAMR